MEVVNYDPAHEWDVYISKIEQDSEDYLAEARCLDCKHCYEYHLDPDIGFCIENMVFINPNDGVIEYGLEGCFKKK